MPFVLFFEFDPPPGDSTRNPARRLVEFRASDRQPERAGPRNAVAAELQAKRFWVSGLVQGVGFRFFAVRVAQRIGVAGYTRNLSDGRVEVYAVGDHAQLVALREELQRGPRLASIAGVAEEDVEVLPRYSDGFSIEMEP